MYDTRLRSGPRKRARLEFYRAHIAELTTEFSIASIAEQAGITKQKSWGILRRLAEDGLIVTTKRGGRNRTFKRGDIA